MIEFVKMFIQETFLKEALDSKHLKFLFVIDLIPYVSSTIFQFLG